MPNGSGSVELDGPVLQEVWDDMRDTVAPSWLSSAPANLGSASHGKLSADQWRTACTVNLVITLIRLWGVSTSSTRHRNLLDNYLALVAAIRWATMRATSARHIEIVATQFQVYFQTLVPLYSVEYLRPNSHLSLHLAECLREFGPVHGWWGFAFERYNGIMTRQNSNNRPGTVSPLCMPDS